MPPPRLSRVPPARVRLRRGTAGEGATLPTLADASGITIGVDFPRADTDFWNSYNSYVPQFAEQFGVDMAAADELGERHPEARGQRRRARQPGAKSIVMAPQDTGAIASTLNDLAGQGIPVVTVDTRPDAGPCTWWCAPTTARTARRPASTSARRSAARATSSSSRATSPPSTDATARSRSPTAWRTSTRTSRCSRFPTEWAGDKAAAGLQTVLTQTNDDVDGIYMQAGGVFLARRCRCSTRRASSCQPVRTPHHHRVERWHPRGAAEAIRDGSIDATVSQPADSYADHGLYYAIAAAQGLTFAAGPTDHDSTIIELPNGLEDQLPAPLVTREAGTVGDFQSIGVDDRSLWGNNL